MASSLTSWPPPRRRRYRSRTWNLLNRSKEYMLKNRRQTIRVHQNLDNRRLKRQPFLKGTLSRWANATASSQIPQRFAYSARHSEYILSEISQGWTCKFSLCTWMASSLILSWHKNRDLKMMIISTWRCHYDSKLSRGFASLKRTFRSWYSPSTARLWRNNA